MHLLFTDIVRGCADDLSESALTHSISSSSYMCISDPPDGETCFCTTDMCNGESFANMGGDFNTKQSNYRTLSYPYQHSIGHVTNNVQFMYIS